MNTITATGEHVYTLESGTIYRRKYSSPKYSSVYIGPVGAVSSIMTTDSHLYALMSDGAVERRYHDGESWSDVEAPSDIAQLSSDDDYIYALTTGSDVYRRLRTTGAAFHIDASLSSLSGLIQLDHDEEFNYALSSDGFIYVAKDNSAWSLYPVPLLGVAEIAAGLGYVYARLADGRVYRSKHDGYSGWILLGSYNDVTGMCIETTHFDRLWMQRPSGVVSQGVKYWPSESFVVEGWVTSDWVTDDWVEVA